MSTSNVIDLSELRDRNMEYDPHFNVFAMCLSCKNKWVGTVHFQASLFNLECPKCKVCDSFASLITEDYLMAHNLDDESIRDQYDNE